MPENNEGGPPKGDNVVRPDFTGRSNRTTRRQLTPPEVPPSTELITETRIGIGGERPAEIHVGTDPVTGNRAAEIRRPGQEPEKKSVADNPIGRGLTGIFDDLVAEIGDPTASETKKLPKHRQRSTEKPARRNKPPQ
jgi:hypothetical protein